MVLVPLLLLLVLDLLATPGFHNQLVLLLLVPGRWRCVGGRGVGGRGGRVIDAEGNGNGNGKSNGNGGE